MKLDVTQVLNGRLDRMPFAYTMTPETADLPEDAVELPEDVTFPGEDCCFTITGEIRSVSGYLRLCAHVTVTYCIPCARCLDPMHASVSFDMERTVRSGEAAQNAAYADDEEWDGVLDDVLYLTDSHVCLDGDVMEQFVLELPLVSLCREDCPGLCPHCGKKRTEGCDCAQKEEKTVDPRWAKLQTLLDACQDDPHKEDSGEGCTTE